MAFTFFIIENNAIDKAHCFITISDIIANKAFSEFRYASLTMLVK